MSITNPEFATVHSPRDSEALHALPMAELRARHDQFMVPNYAPISIIPERGEGAKLWDKQGRMYLDFAAGIAVSALGHAHPVLCQALHEQAARFWHVSNLLTHQPAIELAQRLCHLTFAERVFFASSGSEVNEAALKLARRYALEHFTPAKNQIIAFENAFHGRTFFAVCVGGQAKYSDGFGPKPGAITHLPFNDLDALQQSVTADTCAVIMEPIQGESGVHPARTEFMQAARQLCDQHNALLIFDEVQTGAGRSGYLYMYQKVGVTPDILTTAKGLGGGFPIGAMLTTEKIAASLNVGSHGSTFGGNPLACAVANKLLGLLSTPPLLADVRAKGQLLQTGLQRLGQRLGVFQQVRGHGLLLGCELVDAWQGRAREILQACVEHGLLILVAGDNVLRLAPPLNIEEAELHTGLELMEKAIAALPPSDEF